jgi:hypothetical protein
MSNLYSKKLARLGVAVATGAAFLLAVPASPAAAATNRNGVCEPGEFCLYYGYFQYGSVSDFGTADIPNYGENPRTCYVFKGPGNGKDECVKNNAYSMWNRTGYSVTVYYYSGYKGQRQVLGPNSSANLDDGLGGENASHKFG